MLVLDEHFVGVAKESCSLPSRAVGPGEGRLPWWSPGRQELPSLRVRHQPNVWAHSWAGSCEPREGSRFTMPDQAPFLECSLPACKAGGGSQEAATARRVLSGEDPHGGASVCRVSSPEFLGVPGQRRSGRGDRSSATKRFDSSMRIRMLTCQLCLCVARPDLASPEW